MNSPTGHLRFIEKEGKRILQQEHWVGVMFDPETGKTSLKPGEEWPREWRDVAVVKQEEKKITISESEFDEMFENFNPNCFFNPESFKQKLFGDERYKKEEK